MPSQPDRLVRLAPAAYGRTVAVVFGQPDAEAAAGLIRSAVNEARDTIGDARRAAAG